MMLIETACPIGGPGPVEGGIISGGIQHIKDGALK